MDARGRGRTAANLASIPENLNQGDEINRITAAIGNVAGAAPAAGTTRDQERIFNLIDLNIIPINVHALMREMPLVNQGVFRFTGNAMYLFGFFLFWAIAVAFDSSAALVVAGFSHLYIWVHYYATEEPDLDYLHAPASTTRGEGR